MLYARQLPLNNDEEYIMFRLLSDLEVALNELLVACRESVDHFRDGIELISEENIASEFKQFASEREPFIQMLEQKIRDLGDLPSVPDPDKEDGEMLIHHLGAAVSEDYTGKVVQQRIDAEQRILEIIKQARENDDNNACETLLDNLERQVNNVIKKLAALTQTV
jgi:hypothetical protein